LNINCNNSVGAGFPRPHPLPGRLGGENPLFTMTREGDSLMTQATGQPKFELFPESETKFFLKIVDAQVTFVNDDKGAVTHLILHQRGDQKAKKIK